MYRIAILALSFLLLSSCGYTRHFAWDSVNAHYALTDWPARSVTAQVTDGRRETSDDSRQLEQLTKAVVTEALAGARGTPGLSQVLQVEIVDHEVSLRGPMWNAVTRFRATLSEDGRLVQTWNASGVDKRWNVLPAYIDADNSAKEGFKQAVKDLMTQLSAYRPTGKTPGTTASPPAPPAAAPVITPSKKAQIELLQRLRDSGSITADQFAVERAKIILAPAE